MRNKLFYKALIIGTITLLIVPIIGAETTKTNEKNQTERINNKYENTASSSYTNLTIEEVWTLISDPTNGIQILIDVRTPEEYLDERIYTSSFREKTRLFPLQIMQRSEIFLRIFMMLYKNHEIIIYCRSANRSFIATQLLIENGFSGKIYNMLGGINEWRDAGLPTAKGLLPFNFRMTK